MLFSCGISGDDDDDDDDNNIFCHCHQAFRYSLQIFNDVIGDDVIDNDVDNKKIAIPTVAAADDDGAEDDNNAEHIGLSGSTWDICPFLTSNLLMMMMILI